MSSKFIDSLALFVEIVKSGGFSVVARHRGMATSSVARQIDALESELRVALFTRSTRSMKPTQAGEILFHRALRILDEVAEARSELTSLDQEVQGVLRISCLPTFGRRYVLPCLNLLFQKYPALRVDLDLTERLTDPTAERQDASIRFGEQPDSALIATRIASQRYVICASPMYLLRYGIPLTSDDIYKHRLIDKRHRASALGWREVLAAHRVAHTAYSLECDDFDVQRMAALAGSGVARLPDWVVGDDVHTGDLRELKLEGINPTLESGVYLVRAHPKASAKLIAFMETLQSTIGRTPVWCC